MATLQRSSVSFRRQGSSGRIWNTSAAESKIMNGVATSHMYGEESEILTPPQMLKINDKTFDSTHDIIKSSSSPSPSSECKLYRNVLSSFFGRCMR